MWEKGQKRVSTDPEHSDGLEKSVDAMDPDVEVKLSLGTCQYFESNNTILRTEQQLPAF